MQMSTLQATACHHQRHPADEAFNSLRNYVNNDSSCRKTIISELQAHLSSLKIFSLIDFMACREARVLSCLLSGKSQRRLTAEGTIQSGGCTISESY